MSLKLFLQFIAISKFINQYRFLKLKNPAAKEIAVYNKITVVSLVIINFDTLTKSQISPYNA